MRLSRNKDAVNAIKYQDIYNYSHFMTMYRNIYAGTLDFIGFGENFNSRFAANVLFTRGQLAIWKDPDLGFLCGAATPGPDFDIYGEPNRWTVHTPNAKTFQLDRTNSVLVSDQLPGYAGADVYPVNDTAPAWYRNFGFMGSTGTARPMSMALILDQTVRMLTLIRNREALNVKNLTMPLVITGPKEMELTSRTIGEYIEAGIPIIYIGDKTDGGSFRPENVKNLPVNVPNAIGTLSAEFDKIYNYGLSQIGVNSIGTEKKERLLVDEVNANNDLTNAVAVMRQNCLNDGIERLRKLTGEDTVDIVVRVESVEPNTMGVNESEDPMPEIKQKEGEENG